jgi:DNA-binding transcriptional LysR family regulator
LDLDVSALKVVQELPSNGAALEAARDSHWVTATSERLAAPLIQTGLIKPVQFELPRRPFLLLKHKQRYSSSAAQAFIDMIKIDPTA